jgi:hypothetical protein
MTPTQPLLAFRCSHPSIGGGRPHLYHAKSAVHAALQFAKDCGKSGTEYQIRVESDTFFGSTHILCTPR